MPLTAHDLAPGEFTTVRAGWRTHGKRGRVGDTLGIQFQVATALSIQNFRLQAEVAPDVSVQPETVAFGGDRPLALTITLQLRDSTAASG